MKKKLLLCTLLSGILLSCSDNKTDNHEPPDGDLTVILPDDEIPATIPHQGFYVINEDWYGHQQGTVNRVYYDGRIVYRAYRKANPGLELGTTTQYAMVWGRNIYFISKQGSRLVVADAETLERKAVIQTLGGDGRTCVGVSANTVYLGTTTGVRVFRANKMALGDFVKGAGGGDGDLYTGQYGNMVYAEGRVFAVKQSTGIVVIDATRHEVEQVIEIPSPGGICRSKDGYLWATTNTTTMLRIDPYTLETHPIEMGATTGTVSWGAWTPSSLVASQQQNVIYWSASSKTYRYDIDKDHFEQLEGITVSPKQIETLTDRLLSLNYSGQTIARVYNPENGVLEHSYELFGGLPKGEIDESEIHLYWFPSMCLSEDRNAPHILPNQIILKPGESKKICLSDMVYDADNASKTITKTLDLPASNDVLRSRAANDTLYLEAGKTGYVTFDFYACSNGVEAEKRIRVDVREKP